MPLWQPVAGFFLVDKPAGPSSAGVSNRIKWLLKQRGAPKGIKVGHGGTLDPFATGLLPIAVGKATKHLQALLDGPKTYRFTLVFGTGTNTSDATGTPTATSSHIPSASDILAVLPQFTGPILQTPPAFSALKVNGQRAYTLARNGQEVALQPRPVTIHSLVLEETSGPTATFTAHVSKGTYIRTLGKDIAQALETVGHLSALRRLTHGPFRVEDAISFETLDKLLRTSEELPHFHPLDAYPAAGNES